MADNPRVRPGIREAVLLGCEQELRHRNPSAVRALLARIDEPPAEVVEAVAALESRLAAERTALVRLAQIEEDFDPAVGRVPRGRIFRGVFAALGLLGLLVIPARALGVAFSDRRFYVSSAIGPLVVLILSATTAFSFRERLLRNRVGRFYAACFALLLVALSMNRLAGLILGQPFAHTFVRDSLVSGVVSIAAALVIEPVFYVTAAVFAVAFGASLAAPFFAPAIFMAAVLVDLGIIALAKVRTPRRWVARTPPGSAPPPP